MMKKISVFLLTLYCLLHIFTACKKEFSINAGWKDITVVYGLLDQGDAIHYIRVNKAFLGEGNSLLMAKSFDSTNYPKGVLDVKLLEYINYPGNPNKTYSLTWDTVRKDIGVFYDPTNPEQTVFKTTANLNQNYTYQLVITNLKTGKIITGLTNLVSSFDIVSPGPSLKFTFTGTSTIKWYSTNNGASYQLTIRFHYTEINNITNISTSNYVDWFPIQTVSDNSNGTLLTRDFKADPFYYNLSSHIAVNPNVKRIPGKVDFIFLVADNDLNTYLTINQPSNSVVQEKPEFTNINNGIGIFASRYTNTRSLDLSAKSLDSLGNGRYTKNLGFPKP